MSIFLFKWFIISSAMVLSSDIPLGGDCIFNADCGETMECFKLICVPFSVCQSSAKYIKQDDHWILPIENDGKNWISQSKYIQMADTSNTTSAFTQIAFGFHQKESLKSQIFQVNELKGIIFHYFTKDLFAVLQFNETAKQSSVILHSTSIQTTIEYPNWNTFHHKFCRNENVRKHAQSAIEKLKSAQPIHLYGDILKDRKCFYHKHDGFVLSESDLLWTNVNNRTGMLSPRNKLIHRMSVRAIHDMEMGIIFKVPILNKRGIVFYQFEDGVVYAVLHCNDKSKESKIMFYANTATMPNQIDWERVKMEFCESKTATYQAIKANEILLKGSSEEIFMRLPDGSSVSNEGCM